MAVESVILPKLGAYTEDVLLSAWCAAEGESVEPGTVVLEMETDKTTAEVEAETAGWLHQLVTAGSTVPIGTIVGQVASTREEYEALLGAATPTSDGNPFLGYIDKGGASALATAAQPQEPAPGRDAAARSAPLASPRARDLLKRLGYSADDLARIEGTGPGGRILDRDVAGWAEAQTVPAAPPAGPAIAERIPLRGRRGTIATRLVSSLQTAAQLTSVLEIDVRPLVELRSRLAAGEPALRVGVTSIVVELVASALRAHPLLNARVVGDEIEVLSDVNVGVAVDTQDGLLVPVVHGADRLSLDAINARIADVAGRARAGTLTPDDVSGATFTVSNGGIHNVDMTTAILDPPQVAILWIGRIRDRPVVVGDAIAVRPTFQACLTFDHRAIDGGPAAAFLTTFAELVATLPGRS
jgi:pyruvate dehydrogenase E2 component (dihydrolipoamide acetyltransferase)